MPFTTIKSNEMKPMNLPGEEKKFEEQEMRSTSLVPCRTRRVGSSRAKKEITQFDGDIVKKMMINEISTFLNTIDNVKISPERFDSEVTRTVSIARKRFRTHC